jgi:hypothetical protein
MTLGAVISALARQGLAGSGGGTRAQRNGIPLLPGGENERPVTLETVNQLLDEQPRPATCSTSTG